jgi:DNA-directed RNA polymerase II subunit RPB1
LLTNFICSYTTQHFSGIASKNVTLGVPRLKELVDVTKNIKKPVMTIWLKKPFSNSQESANIACRMMEQVQLSDVVKAVHIVKRSEMPVELSFLDNMSQIFNGSQMNPDNYCMIFDLDRSLIMEHGLTPRDVKQAIERSLGQKRVIVESSEYNMKRWSVVVHSHQVNTALAQVTNNNENIKRTVARGLLSRLSEYLKENVRIKGVQ